MLWDATSWPLPPSLPQLPPPVTSWKSIHKHRDTKLSPRTTREEKPQAALYIINIICGKIKCVSVCVWLWFVYVCVCIWPCVGVNMQNKRILTSTYTQTQSHDARTQQGLAHVGNLLSPTQAQQHVAGCTLLCVCVRVCVHNHVPKQMKCFSTINNKACYVPCAQATWLLRGNNPCNSNMKVHSNIVAAEHVAEVSWVEFCQSGKVCSCRSWVLPEWGGMLLKLSVANRKKLLQE